jgi:hypothetical protein
MLQSGKNILTTPCKDVDRTVPYFVEQDKYGQETFNETMNKYVYRQMSALNNIPVSLNDKHLSIEGLEYVPDGMLKIKKANDK